jgi:hypothetical protein
LTLEQNRYALQDWVRENFTRKGLIADVNIHAPSKDGDDRNVHAHVMVVLRKLDGSEFVRTKERFGTYTEKDEARKAELVNLRQSWARIGNRHLERHGHAPSLDWRSLLEQGIERAATIHQGKEATAIERKGRASDLGNVNREIEAANAHVINLAAEREKREAQRDAWIAERKEEREQRRQPNWIEQRIADQDREARLYSAPITVDRDGQRVTGADVLADRLKPEGEREFRSAMARSYAEAFSARLDDAGIALVRVTAADREALAALREASEREGPTRRTATGTLRHTSFGDVKEGDIAAVTKSGEVYRLNPEKLGHAVLPEKLPSVIQARMAFQVDRERTKDLHQERKDEQIIALDAAAEAREKRAAQLNQWKQRSTEKVASKGFDFGGKVLGAIVGGALRFLDGLFSSPKKPTAQEVHDRAQAAGNVETQHAQAHEVARQDGDLRLARTLELLRQQDEARNLSFAQRYGTPPTREADPRERDEGYERERERDRGYER